MLLFYHLLEVVLKVYSDIHKLKSFILIIKQEIFELSMIFFFKVMENPLINHNFNLIMINIKLFSFKFFILLSIFSISKPSLNYVQPYSTKNLELLHLYHLYITIYLSQFIFINNYLILRLIIIIL